MSPPCSPNITQELLTLFFESMLSEAETGPRVYEFSDYAWQPQTRSLSPSLGIVANSGVSALPEPQDGVAH